MILRQNWLDTEEHQEYRRSVHQDSWRTQQTRASQLKQLLMWADAKPLTRAPEIRPTFPEWLAVQVHDGQRAAYAGQEAAVSAAKTFFDWAVAAYPRRYRAVTRLWLDSLRPIKPKTGVKLRKAYTLENVRAMLRVAQDGLMVERAKAAVAFLFLSGARIGAFVTLPIKAIDLDKRRVQQWTELEVRTKFGKSATTFLLDIPDLLDVVRAWDGVVRPALGPDDCWYANIEGAYQKAVVSTRRDTGEVTSLYEGLRFLCDAAGVPYMSPHKLRHGHVMHALSHSKTPADWKAISQNVMHSNLSTTDGIYGILKDDEIADRIGRLGGSEPAGDLSQAEILRQIQALMAKLKE